MYGVTVVAKKRKQKIIEHPDPSEVFEKDDIVYVLGKPEQVAHTVDLISKENKH